MEKYREECPERREYRKKPKAEVKLEKMMKKQEAYVLNPKVTQKYIKKVSEKELNSNCSLDPFTRKAIKWWQRFDEKDFRPVSIKEAESIANLTTSAKTISSLSADASSLGHRAEIIQHLSPAQNQKSIRIRFNPPPKALSVCDLDTCVSNWQTQDDTPSSDQSKNSSPKSSLTKALEQGKINPLQIKNDKKLSENLLLHFSGNTNLFHPLDEQIALWEWELYHLNESNKQKWRKLLKWMSKNQQEIKVVGVDKYDKQIACIKEKLLWNTILRYFEKGFEEKTQKMLENYKITQKNNHSKPQKGTSNLHEGKFVQTDCKICFSSYNNDSNLVVYCDNCSTSYHMACYGLQKLPEEQQYFCDKCVYIRQQESNQGQKMKKIYCQICSKSSFPMKRIGDHFYHVTCLVLLNFAQFSGGKLQLRGSRQHLDVQKFVIQNQLQHQECDYCRKLPASTLGYQFICTYPGCNISVHPICGYLSGCRMNVKKTHDKKLVVEVVCNNHGQTRVQQTYIRRYMCNEKSTSDLKLEQFTSIYEEEVKQIASLREGQQKLKKKYQNRILHLSKLCKQILKNREQIPDLGITTGQSTKSY